MLTDIPVTELQIGDDVQGFYIFRDPAHRTSAAGKPYLTARLTDRSGSVDMILWSYSGPLGPDDAGAVVKVRGHVNDFRGAPQLAVSRIRLATEEDEYDLTALVPSAPIDPDEAMAEIRALADSLGDPDYRALAGALLTRHEASFRRIPAAKSVHHGFVGGLLMHTLHMLRLAEVLAGMYPLCDRDLLLTGTLLHDLAKEREFLLSPVGLVTEYSVPGQLLGHLVMGAQEAAAVAAELGVPEEKSVLVQHMILSHHGEPDFGAAVRPQIAEAELLSLIDLIDSRMEIYREALAETDLGRFSQRVFALDRRVYKHRDPEEAAGPEEGGQTP